MLPRKRAGREFLDPSGLTCERVLVWPTDKIRKMLTEGAPLDERRASELYVAVTRAEQSVGFVIDDPGQSTLRY